MEHDNPAFSLQGDVIAHPCHRCRYWRSIKDLQRTLALALESMPPEVYEDFLVRLDWSRRRDASSRRTSSVAVSGEVLPLVYED